MLGWDWVLGWMYRMVSIWASFIRLAGSIKPIWILFGEYWICMPKSLRDVVSSSVIFPLLVVRTPTFPS